jgi:Tol biopolymer transport system component
MFHCCKIGLMLLLAGSSAYAQVPAGKVIYVSSDANDTNSQLFTINSNGSGERKVTDANKQCSLPSVYKSRVVYREKNGRNYNILISNVERNGPVKELIHNQVVCNPHWSTDGKLIAYEYYQETDGNISVMDSNGQNQRILITHARHPVWSQDNQRLYFTRNYEVFVFDMKTHAEKQLTHLSGKHILAKWPAISPDEKTLAFVGYGSSGLGNLFIIDLETNKETKRIDNCSMPCWTSDPKYLVCEYHPKNATSQIIILNVETGISASVTHNNRGNYEPCWVNTY